MRKKKGILITAVLACVVALGVGGYALAAQTGKKEVVQETKGGQTILPVLKVTEDLEMVNQEVWEHFVSETKKGNPAGIRVEMVKKPCTDCFHITLWFLYHFHAYSCWISFLCL